jgi:hypothetical protein
MTRCSCARLAIFDLAGAAILFLLLRDVSSGQAGGRGLEPEAAKSSDNVKRPEVRRLMSRSPKR